MKILILTTYGADEYVYEALRVYEALCVGAGGFLLKMDSPPRLVDAVNVVAAGEALLAPESTRRSSTGTSRTRPRAAHRHRGWPS